MIESPTHLLRCLLADVKRHDPHVQGLDRDTRTIEGRFEHEGFSFLAKSLATYGKYFDKYLAMRRVGPIPGFKLKPGTPLPAFLQGLVSLVFDSTTGLLRSDPSVSAIKSIRQICYFFKKTLVETEVQALASKSIRAFSAAEQQIVTSEQRYDSAIRHVSTYILKDLQGSATPDFFEYVRHGPGAVAERSTPNGKWSLLSEQIEEFDLFPESSIDLLFVDKDKGHFATAKSSPALSSRYVTVAKDSTSRRGITVEPLMKQFYQQGLNAILRTSIERCRVLRNSLDLTDQSKSQKLARIGSITGAYATIDLSSASDLLSKRLVSLVFHQHSGLFEALDRSRSLFDGSELRKYAGMGNATTFPVQSITFSVLGILAVILSRKDKINSRAVAAAARLVRVYGDDIAIPTDSAQFLIGLLELYGLKVNQTKTFLEGNFRESCGHDYFNGVQVTPIYLRVPLDRSLRTTSQLESLVSTSNQLWLDGYYSLSDAIKDFTESVWRRKLPYVLRESGNVGWITRSRIVLRTRFSTTIHAPVYRALKSSAVKFRDELNGYPALLKYFLTPLLGRPKGHLKKSVERYSNQVRSRWVPVFPVTSDYLP